MEKKSKETLEFDDKGVVIQRQLVLGRDRYYYDYIACSLDKGWTIFSTDYDAWYFGIWVQESEHKIMQYIEGDEILIQCRDEESFRAELIRMAEFYKTKPSVQAVTTQVLGDTSALLDSSETLRSVDGFTPHELEAMIFESIVQARCTECGFQYDVEPDARDYDCYEGCEAKGAVTSPLIKLGLI